MDLHFNSIFFFLWKPTPFRPKLLTQVPVTLSQSRAYPLSIYIFFHLNINKYLRLFIIPSHVSITSRPPQLLLHLPTKYIPQPPVNHPPPFPLHVQNPTLLYAFKTWQSPFPFSKLHHPFHTHTTRLFAPSCFQQNSSLFPTVNKTGSTPFTSHCVLAMHTTAYSPICTHVPASLLRAPRENSVRHGLYLKLRLHLYFAFPRHRSRFSFVVEFSF